MFYKEKKDVTYRRITILFSYPLFLWITLCITIIKIRVIKRTQGIAKDWRYSQLFNLIL